MTLQAPQSSLTFTLDQLLRDMCELGASDLHVGVGSPPAGRVDGSLQQLGDYPKLTQEMLEGLLFPVLTPDQNEKLLKNRELDFSYSVPGLSRFRGNILWQRGTLGAVFRAIPSRPLTLEELKLPAVVTELATRPPRSGVGDRTYRKR